MSKSNLYDAHHNWANRPVDERFWTVSDLVAKTKKTHEARSREAIVLSVDDAMMIGGKLSMSHWAFSQLCSHLNIPSGFVRRMPMRLAAETVKHWLQKEDLGEKTISVVNGEVEAITSERYSYVPNYKICEGIQALEKMGWRVPPARPAAASAVTRKATKDDVLASSKFSSLAIKVGDEIAPAGLYSSDRDMFAFMVHERHGVDDGNGKNLLRRGIFVENSEVAARAFKITTFLYDTVCGNHIVWGAKDVNVTRVRHLGAQASEKMFAALESELEWDPALGEMATKKIRRARTTMLGKSADEVADKLTEIKRLYLCRGDLRDAVIACEETDADRVNPLSLWGVVTGMTRLSQRAKNMDDRLKLDAGCMRLMEMAGG